MTTTPTIHAICHAAMHVDIPFNFHFWLTADPLKRKVPNLRARREMQAGIASLQPSATNTRASSPAPSVVAQESEVGFYCWSNWSLELRFHLFENLDPTLLLEVSKWWQLENDAKLWFDPWKPRNSQRAQLDR